MSRTLILPALIFLFALPAAAEPKRLYAWPQAETSWKTSKNYDPYLTSEPDAQAVRWAYEDWYVQDWLAQRDPQNLVEGFFTADILRGQGMDDGAPILTVGPNFYHLSGFDKRRVMRTVDHVFGITDNAPVPVIILRDWHTSRAIGEYNRDGLTLH